MNIIAANRIIDGTGSLNETDSIIETIDILGLRTRTFKIAPAKMGWETPLPKAILSVLAHH